MRHKVIYAYKRHALQAHNELKHQSKISSGTNLYALILSNLWNSNIFCFILNLKIKGKFIIIVELYDGRLYHPIQTFPHNA